MNKISNGEMIGSFEIQSGRVRVSDPCYEKDTWCAGTIDNVENGNWEAYIKFDKKIVSELIAIFDDISKEVLKTSNWIEEDIEVGIDSGQCGIFDDKFYPEGKTGEYGDEDTFYGQCCDITTNGAGVLDFGAVSVSGWGDGSYNCYVLKDKKNIVGIKIAFIEEYETDNFDDCSEYNDKFDFDEIYPTEDDTYLK